jgi:hypothetical protein
MLPSVTNTLRNWIIALSIMLGCLMLIGYVWTVEQGLEERICFDRTPWWGAPEDPDSECSGLWWAGKHPGEYPWTLPQ